MENYKIPLWMQQNHGNQIENEELGERNVPFPMYLVPWDDGFIPSGCNQVKGHILLNIPRCTKHRVEVIDDAVSVEIADLLYSTTITSKVWGVYITKEQITREKDTKSVWTKPQHNEEYCGFLAQEAIKEFLVSKSSTITKDDWENTHGVAVWAVASNENDETEYHLDYAEWLRYETNIIIPPIYGATLHVSQLSTALNYEHDSQSSMNGGDFYANVNGLKHYQKYGYKTRCRKEGKINTDAVELLTKSEEGWKHVPYKFRRGIVCDGELPHFASRVKAITPNTVTKLQRVVVGFNLFPYEIGEYVARYPEHSAAFNRFIKISQTLAKLSTLKVNNDKISRNIPTPWTIESIKTNPKQAEFIKLLAKKVKQAQTRAASHTNTK